MTPETKSALIGAIRKGLNAGMRPTAILNACCQQFKLSRKTVEKHMRIVRSENIPVFPEQIAEICQDSLISMVKNSGIDHEISRLRTIEKIMEFFDVLQSPSEQAITYAQLVGFVKGKHRKGKITSIINEFKLGGVSEIDAMLMLESCGFTTHEAYALLNDTPATSRPLKSMESARKRSEAIQRTRRQQKNKLYPKRKWNSANIFGQYNIRSEDGMLIESTKESARVLAAKLLDSMAEINFDVSAMPDDEYPKVIWHYAKSFDELQKFCDLFSLEVCMERFRDTVRVVLKKKTY